MPAERAASSTARQGAIAGCSRDTSLPSAAPKPPVSRKSRCMSMITSAVRPLSTARGAGSASMVMTGTAASDLLDRASDNAARSRPPTGSLTGEDDVLHQRIDLVGPAIAAEHAVVPDPGLNVVALEVGAQAAAQIV